MKKGMHLLLVFLSCFCLCMSFFIVPVSAEGDIYYPPESSYGAYQYFFQMGYNHLMLTSNDNVTYNVSLDQTGTISGSESGSEHTTGTINSNGSSTLGAKYMTCTTNNGTSASQTYSCYFSNRSNAVSNSQSINIGFNENTYTSVNNTITLTPNTDITGTLKSNTTDKFYTYLPWLTGTYTHESSYNWQNSFWISSQYDIYNDIYLIVYTRQRVRYGGVAVYKQNDNFQITTDLYDDALNGMFRTILHFHCTEGAGNFTFDIAGLQNYDVLPIFLGYFVRMPDDVALSAGLRRTPAQLLQDGNSDTPSVVNSSNTAKDNLDDKIGTFDSIENNSVSDMTNNINNLNVVPDILSNSKFLNSAQWVKVQFDRMTVNTPIGSVLSFSLILGITLIFLGKIR